MMNKIDTVLYNQANNNEYDEAYSDGRVSTILILLELIFGDISDNTILTIQNCSKRQLDRLIENILDIESESDISEILM